MDEIQLQDDGSRACVANVIDGRDVLLPSSASFPVTSAREGRVVHYGQTATEAVAKQAVDSALATFRTYKRTPVHERRRLLLRAADLFESNVDEAAKRQMRETSCVAEWARFTSTQTSTFCREVEANVAQAVKGEIQPSYFGYTHLVFKEPIGPVLLIPPWNASVVLCVRGIANALAAGCTVVLKASEMCPWTHQFVARTFHEAGFPPGAINMVMADRPYAATITEALISHPGIRKIEFIGSEAVGKHIGMTAAKYLKPVVMELGDQSPAIVLDDANLDHAAQLVAKGLSLHHGQVCFSTERIIVSASIQDAFVRALDEAMQTLPSNMAAVSQAHADKAKAALDAAVAGGAEYLIGDGTMADRASIRPSVLVNVDRHSALSQGEAFAPTAFLIPVPTDEEAITEANSRSGGLSAAIFSSNQERALRIARELEFGMVNVNNMTLFAEPAGPGGGVKGSGWGSNNGHYGIEHFLHNKAVSLVPTIQSAANGMHQWQISIALQISHREIYSQIQETLFAYGLKYGLPTAAIAHGRVGSLAGAQLLVKYSQHGSPEEMLTEQKATDALPALLWRFTATYLRRDCDLDMSDTRNETAPLLAATEDGASLTNDSHEVARAKCDKIPKIQLGLLCYARMMEAVAYFCIFPFINEMIWKTGGVQKTDTAFYAGLIEALFAIVQAVSMGSWSAAARHNSKKSIVAVSLLGMGLATAAFGFSTEIWQMMLARAVAGAFAASAPALRLLFYDISAPSTEARIFSFFPVSNNFGMFFGPFIGGFLVNSEIRSAAVPTLGRYPYALATVVGGFVIASASITTAVFVKEPTSRSQNWTESRSYGTWELIKLPSVASALFVYACTLMLSIGFNAVLPAFMFTDIAKGGYQFTPRQISIFIALAGFSQASWTLLVYPLLERRVGRVRLIRTSFYGWPLLFLLGPVCNALLKADLKAVFWTAAPLGLLIGNYISIVFSALSVLVNDVAPSKQALGKLNLIALMILSITRAAAPALFNTIFAAGARFQILDGELIWAVLIGGWIFPMTALQFYPPAIQNSD